MQEEDPFDTGMKTLRQMGWPVDESPPHPDLDQRFWDHTVENLAGRIWSRPGLSMRERELVHLGSLVALDLPVITMHFRHCHTFFTEDEVREVILIAGYYAGWPRFTTATIRFNRQLKETGSTWPEEKRSAPYQGEERTHKQNVDWRDRGLKLHQALGWGGQDGVLHHPEHDHRFWNHTLENMAGRILARSVLPLREREILILGTLMTIDTDGVLSHMRGCHNVGINEDEVREIIFQAGYFAGWPRITLATRRFNRVLNEPDSTWPHAMRSKHNVAGHAPS